MIWDIIYNISKPVLVVINWLFWAYAWIDWILNIHPRDTDYQIYATTKCVIAAFRYTKYIVCTMRVRDIDIDDMESITCEIFEIDPSELEEA